MNNIILLITLHVIGDFYLRSDTLAKSKKGLHTSMLLHSLIYIVPYFIIFTYTKENFLLLLIIIVSHVLIDIFSIRLKAKYKDKECLIFCIDQILHVGLLCYCSVYTNLRSNLPIQFSVLSLAILILMKPVSIFISLAFDSIFINEKSKDDIKIGRYIGYLERIIILMLCLFDSISAIGFVIAAKTLVRYKDINTNEDRFQEKYLIGTLLSTIGALSCFALVKYANPL